MKLHFEPDLDYQRDAIEAVCDLFCGQEQGLNVFTVSRQALGLQQELGLESDSAGVGNRLRLLPDELLFNLREVQTRNGLRPSEALASNDFTVEMETGTGKTYVYLRTILELNQRYGFTKFVIVVPSVAIKEGVYKAIDMTREHLRALYSGVVFDSFLYDSSKLGQVRDFATSPNVRIMVVTVGAINKKDVNNLYKDTEKVGGGKPIDLVRDTRPIVIVDEPQSVDGGLGGEGKKALEAMCPLCTLRYSATHADKHHMVYRLDAVDAYEKKLVKQIEVASLEVEGGHNKAFVRLLGTSTKRGAVSAKVEVDCQRQTGVSRATVTVQDGDDLAQVTGRSVYAEVRIGQIDCGKGAELMEVKAPGAEHWLKVGQAIGDVDGGQLKRLMIRRTIKEHLDKELRLRPKGIKVLSLFFIDHVDGYRACGSEKGPYALMFEEEYRALATHLAYTSLFHEVDLSADASEVHEGYFSIDKKGGWTDTGEGNQTDRDNAERAYSLIMRDKEKLLSFDTKLKFIFSHSALREGWDNPNVFQICALREMGSEQQRRQTIGRGLRLCVNQDGQRLRGFEVNTLTVVANEGYQKFAEALQHEIEAETGIRFGMVEPHSFAALPIVDANGTTKALGVEASEAIYEHLMAAGHVDAKGKVQDSLRTALKDGTVTVPEAAQAQQPAILALLRKLAGKLDVKNADDRRPIGTRKDVLLGESFQALWDRIKHKTTYRVEFDAEKLIADCARAIREGPPVTKTRVQVGKGTVVIGRGGVTTEAHKNDGTHTLDERDVVLPDVVTDLESRTQLTRRSLARILTESGRVQDLARNPQQFVELCAERINSTKAHALVAGIRYVRIGDEHPFAQELFDDPELKGHLSNMVQATKSVYDHVVYDSDGVEKTFAEHLEQSTAVKVYAKLPAWFQVPTPLGTYNPDWAVLVQMDGRERVYFVAETKGSLFAEDLRKKEAAKIACGKVHFQAIGEDVGASPAHYVQVTTVDDMMAYAE